MADPCALTPQCAVCGHGVHDNPWVSQCDHCGGTVHIACAVWCQRIWCTHEHYCPRHFRHHSCPFYQTRLVQSPAVADGNCSTRDVVAGQWRQSIQISTLQQIDQLVGGANDIRVHGHAVTRRVHWSGPAGLRAHAGRRASVVTESNCKCQCNACSR